MEFPKTEISYINALGQEERGQTYIGYCCVGCKNGIQLGVPYIEFEEVLQSAAAD